MSEKYTYLSQGTVSTAVVGGKVDAIIFENAVPQGMYCIFKVIKEDSGLIIFEHFFSSRGTICDGITLSKVIDQVIWNIEWHKESEERQGPRLSFTNGYWIWFLSQHPFFTVDYPTSPLPQNP